MFFDYLIDGDSIRIQLEFTRRTAGTLFWSRVFGLVDQHQHQITLVAHFFGAGTVPNRSLLAHFFGTLWLVLMLVVLFKQNGP